MTRKTTTPVQGAAAALPESAKKGAVTARSESDSKTKGNKTINQKAQYAIKLNQEQQPMTSATAPQDVFDCIAAGIPREQWGDALAQSIPAPYDRGELAQQVQAVRQADQQAVAQSRGQACAVHESIKDFLFEASDQAALLRDKSKALFALAHFVEVAGETNAAPMQYLAELIDLVGQALESRTGALVTAIEDALQVQRAIEKKGGAV